MSDTTIYRYLEEVTKNFRSLTILRKEAGILLTFRPCGIFVIRCRFVAAALLLHPNLATMEGTMAL